MFFNFTVASVNGAAIAISFAVAILAPGLAGCSVDMPSASSMPGLSSSARANLGGPTSARRAPNRGPGRTVIVAEGDTLMSIGRRYDVPMSVLMDHNTLPSLALAPGTELFVPQLRPSYQR